MKAMGCTASAGLAAVLIAIGSAQAQDREQEPDDGNDPTRINRSVSLSNEYRDIAGASDFDRIKLSFTQPFKPHAGMRITVPLGSSMVDGSRSYGLGNVEVRYDRVFGITPTRAYVGRAELHFDTASRPELGSGQNEFETTFIYARFLSNGAIFAPSFDQTWGIGPHSGRSRTNELDVEFYYVAKLGNPKWHLTVDPAINFDWEAGEQSASLGVQLGRSAWQPFGGHGQIYAKPTIYLGDNRPAEWGVEIGYKINDF